MLASKEGETEKEEWKESFSIRLLYRSYSYWIYSLYSPNFECVNQLTDQFFGFLRFG